MPIGRIRNITKYGALPDVDPYNLPTEAWSMAVNARFVNGTIIRAPVFRSVPAGLAEASVRFVTSNAPTIGVDNVIVGYLSGRLSSHNSGTDIEVTAASYTSNNAESPYTSCRLANVFYVNRDDRLPWYFRSTDTVFQKLTNFTEAATATELRAYILRSCQSALCAFGITKGATVFPTMIKTSEFAVSNTIPGTWDHTDATNNATENILAEMEGRITDAQNLGEGIIIYGLNETWTMQATGGQEVWAYHKLFNDAGAINANCSVEVNKQHYVFGLYDIWTHDGNSKQSICDLKARRFIFDALNVAKSKLCFVAYDDNRKELRFHYASGDGYTAFIGVNGCNRTAIYNLTEQTWSFDDAPSLFSAAHSSLATSLTYATATQTYDTIGGTYFDQEDSSKKVLVAVGDASSTYGLTTQLYAIDAQGPGSVIAYNVDQNATRPVLLERQGIDLDEVVDLRGYKEVTRIYPQGKFEVGAQPLMFEFGSADYFNANVVYSAPQSFDGLLDYHCDYHEGGRYLSMRITHNDFRYFALTGFDVEVNITGDV